MCDMVKTNLTQWPIVLVCENVVNIVMLRTTSTVFQKAGHACRAVRLGGTNGGGRETQFWDQFKRSILHVLTRFFWRPPVTTFVLRDPVTSYVLWQGKVDDPKRMHMSAQNFFNSLSTYRRNRWEQYPRRSFPLLICLANQCFFTRWAFLILYY